MTGKCYAPRETDSLEIASGSVFRNRRIEFVAPIQGEDGTASRIEQRVVLELNDRCGHGIQARAAGLEHGVAGGPAPAPAPPGTGPPAPRSFPSGAGCPRRHAMPGRSWGAVKRFP